MVIWSFFLQKTKHTKKYTQAHHPFPWSSHISSSHFSQNRASLRKAIPAPAQENPPRWTPPYSAPGMFGLWCLHTSLSLAPRVSLGPRVCSNDCWSFLRTGIRWSVLFPMFECWAVCKQPNQTLTVWGHTACPLTPVPPCGPAGTPGPYMANKGVSRNVVTTWAKTEAGVDGCAVGFELWADLLMIPKQPSYSIKRFTK